VRDYRRGARGDSSVKRRTVNADVSDRYGRPKWRTRRSDRRHGPLGQIDMHLLNARTTDAERNRMATSAAGLGLYGRIVTVFRQTVVVGTGER
jgi:hypothetical protein